MRLTIKLGYGVGQLSDGVKNAAFSTFLFFYFNQVLGLPGSLAGAASLLALIVDAVTDPWIGQLSDRFKSRWGRRHPFMLAGALPFGIAMTLLFSPPTGLGNAGLFSWMLGFAIAVRLLLTLFFVPHLSLGAEMVRDYHERTSLIGYRVFFAYVGVLITTVVGFALFFPPSDAYPNGLLNAASYPKFGVFTGALASIAMLYSVVATRSTIGQLSQPIVNPDARNPIFGFITVFSTLRQKSFRILFFTSLIFMALAGLTQTLLVYTATYLLGFATKHLSFLASSIIISLLLASWIAQWLSRTYDKKRALAICVFIGSVFAFTPQMLWFAGLYQPLDMNTRLILVFLLNGISQSFFIAYIIVIDSMLSDTVDEHELNTGRREEGLFFAARSLATKASYGLGSLFAGIALDIIHFPRGVSPEEVAPDAVYKLAVVGGPMIMLLFMSTIFISMRYTLDAQRHLQIRQLIEQKTAAASS